MKKIISPKISVCIPVYETEPYLSLCLQSVLLQSFDSFEVIVLSDASNGRDFEGRKAEKIVNQITKLCNKTRKKNSQNPVSVQFLENENNRGIFEVRRTLCNFAKGEYLCFVDSDDRLADGALETLYNAHLSSENVSYDIIQGSSVSGTFDEEGNFNQAEKNLYSNITFGNLSGHEIFRTWLVEGNLTGILWAKLLRRELVEQAYNQIPYTECNMGDDILLFFFIAQLAKTYIGIEKCVYYYRINSGMSSERKIDSLHKWQLICSSASVFTIISENKNISDEESESLKRQARTYLLSLLQKLKRNVVPQLQDQAYEMLCEWWGKDFVESIEFVIKNQ